MSSRAVSGGVTCPAAVALRRSDDCLETFFGADMTYYNWLIPIGLAISLVGLGYMLAVIWRG